jgi:hypothetical protein
MQMPGGRATDASAAPSSFTVTITSLVKRTKFYSLPEYQAKFGAVANSTEIADRGHELVTKPGEPDMVAVCRIFRDERMETHRDIRHGDIGEYVGSNVGPLARHSSGGAAF